ncbi:hypothetical protein AB0J86_21580 [Micromonospora sp. NPDC049559]|uniref:hypothetical protein n=1 Tax=Micromonospora sp. NPDC049559 TaxID=3155923 RepID=UPI00341E6CEA
MPPAPDPAPAGGDGAGGSSPTLAYDPYPPLAGAHPAGPSMVAPPFGPQPWQSPAPPASRDRGLLIAAVITGVVLLVACSGLVGGLFLLRGTNTAEADRAPQAPPPGGMRSPTAGQGPTGSAAPEAGGESVQQGPQASEYPPTNTSDLDSLCEESTFFPQLPKRAGKAPHPVVLLVGGESGGRYQDGTYYFDEGLSSSVEQTWAAENPGKVQLVACLDRVRTGSTIRSCKYDDPRPETLTLLRADWHLRVYEAATGRKLLDKPMPGDDRSCPYVVLTGADKKIYASVSNRAKLGALRNLVKK